MVPPRNLICRVSCYASANGNSMHSMPGGNSVIFSCMVQVVRSLTPSRASLLFRTMPHAMLLLSPRDTSVDSQQLWLALSPMTAHIRDVTYCLRWLNLASFPGPHAECGSGPGDTWQNSHMCWAQQSWFRVSESSSSIANYCIVVAFFTPWKV